MIVYAHRGSSRAHPENTMEAFAAAMAEGAHGIETDLRLTSDSAVVLAHDEAVPAGPVKRVKVTGATLDELRDATGKTGAPLTTLGELLRLALGRVRLNLEIKDPMAVDRLPRFTPSDGILITSFDLGAVRRTRELFPELRAGLVVERWSEEAQKCVKDLGLSAVSLKVSAFTPEVLKAIHGCGAEVLLWVVNDPARAGELERAGVDGIFSDAPGVVLAGLAGKQ